MSRERWTIAPSFSKKAPYGLQIHLIPLETEIDLVDPMFKLMATSTLASLIYASILSEYLNCLIVLNIKNCLANQGRPDISYLSY
jgi:hypothetical protein